MNEPAERPLIEIFLPQETANDDAYRVVEVARLTGTAVHGGDLIAVFETSKAALEIHAPAAGYLHHQLRRGQRVAIGERIAVIAETQAPPPELFPPRDETAPDPSAGPRDQQFSMAAERLLLQHGLDRREFQGLEVVRREDVERVLERKQKRAGAPSRLEVRPTSASQVLIVGGGGHAKMCIDILRRGRTYEVAGILDSFLAAGEKVLDVPVLGAVEDLPRFRELGFTLAINGIGAADRHPIREKTFRQIKDAGFSVPTLIHTGATVEPSCTLGEGNQCMAGCVIGSGTVVGDNCVINSNAVVSHDCVLGSNVHVAPGAILAGRVHIGDNTLIGMGATVYMHVSIGRFVTVVNGAHVDHAVPDNAVVRRV